MHLAILPRGSRSLWGRSSLVSWFAVAALCVPAWGFEPKSADSSAETALESPPGASEAAPDAGSPKTVVLGSQEPYMAINGAHGRLLPRELARQAILIAARDELGLGTRDATLREAEPADKQAAKWLEIQTADFRGKFVQIKLLDPARPSSRTIVDHRITLPLPDDECFDYLTLTIAAEAFSRSEAPVALRNAGLTGEPNKLVADVAVPADVEQRLGEMNAFSQVAALRALHALQRDQGESPATLGAISRAYANLGQLTQYHWNATHKVFKARALLYAQRLLAREPENPAGYWHRGYALAMTGLHRKALADFDAARGTRPTPLGSPQAATEATEPSPALPRSEDPPVPAEIAAPAPPQVEVPPWARLAELHCRYNDDELLKAAQEGEAGQRELAWLLAYISVEHDDLGPAYALTTGRQALAAVPDCLRIADSMCAFGGISNLHYATTIGPQSLVKSINRRLRPMPGMPADIVALVKQMRTARIRNEPGDAWGRDICSLFEFHPQLIAALDKASDPASDTSEPSWSVLARLIEEPTFIQLVRRGDFIRNGLGMPIDELVRYASPLVATHPYHAFVDSAAVDQAREPAKYWKHFQNFDFHDIELQAWPLITATWNTPHGARMQGNKAWTKAHDHLDETTREYELWERRMDDKARPWYGKAIRQLSPHNPFAAATLIAFDWDESGEKEAAAWETEFAQQPLVTGALARRYRKLKRPDDAKPAYARYIAKSPDQWAFVGLADIYLAEGNVEQWNATLDEFLRHEDFALSHASVQVRIANYYMGQKDFEKARPYAEGAAESGASWAMICAANCCEGLGDYRAAEEYVAQNASRYARQEPTWFLWCKRTGHGDVEQAASLAKEYFARISPHATADDYHSMGLFYLLSGKELAARDAFQKAFKSKPEAFLAVHDALLADASGEPATRDAALQRAIDTPVAKDEARPFNQASIELAKVFQQVLADGDAKALTRDQLDPILDKVKNNGPGTLAYFAARFIQAHGDQELARSYWERCATKTLSLTHILGVDWLRRSAQPDAQ